MARCRAQAARLRCSSHEAKLGDSKKRRQNFRQADCSTITVNWAKVWAKVWLIDKAECCQTRGN